MVQQNAQLDAVIAPKVAAVSDAPMKGGGTTAAAGVGGSGIDELAEIIRAYNRVTDKLQQSHEALQAEVVRLRQQLASADAQLQRSKRLSALGEMAAGIAHEVRNPLAAIQLYASMIEQDLAALDGKLGEPLRCARQIAAAVRGLDGIVGDVLNFSREVAPKPAALPVVEVFERVLAAHRPAIQAAGVKVRYSEIDVAGLYVYADPDMLHRALLNLVRNAVDAMGHVSGQRVMTLDAREDDQVLTLSVADTGPGVDRETIDRLFNPFFTTRATGTGLGLAIVHRIVDAHGGTVAVTNNPHADHGALFELCLPVCQISPVDPSDETAYAGVFDEQ
jgi:signal transduction histidine kinase